MSSVLTSSPPPRRQVWHRGVGLVRCMPNHVHMVTMPSGPEGLARTFAEAHRRKTWHINARNRWTGHLWQSRFGSVTMDEEHLAAAVACVIMNPVRARLAAQPEAWRTG